MNKATTSIFTIQNNADFDQLALDTYRFQYQNNQIYQEFCNHLNRTPKNVNHRAEIPFLPIAFFKSKKVVSSNVDAEMVFTSSGTTGQTVSKHHVLDLEIYHQSFSKGFELFYGHISEYCILALLPSYLEREGSSLIYMAEHMIKESKHLDSGFYLYDFDALKDTLQELESQNQKTLLLGVSFALLDFCEAHAMQLKNTIIMETGGMKGRKKELIRDELHQNLKKGFGVEQIHSEYGMTELLSQAYSMGEGKFKCPPWMKVLTRNTEDPLTLQQNEKTGGLNIIDLANKNSCSFIATQDLGRVYQDGVFEVLGRFDNADVRGCNLMVI